jgi:hypothetical protein
MMGQSCKSQGNEFYSFGKGGIMKSRWMFRISGGLATLALLLAIGSPFMAAQTTDSAAISKLLSEAKSDAVLAEDHAATLESYTHSQLAWQTHASALESMKEHVNNLGKVVKQLNDLRAEGSPWQQEAIDRINPLLRNMADQLTATINHLNDNKGRIQMQAYRDYTHANYDLAARTATVISDFMEYGKAKATAESLEQKLELPAPGGSE